MSAHHKRFPEYNLDLNIFSGSVSTDEMIQSFRSLDQKANWLACFCEDANLSGIGIAHFPAMKQALVGEETETDAAAPKKRSALVTLSAPNELFVRFWSEYASSGVSAPRDRAMFPTIAAACEWLGLPPEVCDMLDATVNETVGH